MSDLESGTKSNIKSFEDWRIDQKWLALERSRNLVYVVADGSVMMEFHPPMELANMKHTLRSLRAT
jgi:hypothetical protein